MTKLVWVAALAILAWRMVAGRWPWESDKLAAKQHAAIQARNLLGVRKGAVREDIIDAHRRLLTQVHPDRGGTTGQVHEANEARDVLLAGLPKDKAGA